MCLHITDITSLKYFGCDNNALTLFKSYLTGRSQRVILNGKTSDYLSADRGVPQGSTLGPLLFSLFTADIASFPKYCSAHQYADDTQLYFSLHLGDKYDALNKIN